MELVIDFGLMDRKGRGVIDPDELLAEGIGIIPVSLFHNEAGIPESGFKFREIR